MNMDWLNKKCSDCVFVVDHECRYRPPLEKSELSGVQLGQYPRVRAYKCIQGQTEWVWQKACSKWRRKGVVCKGYAQKMAIREELEKAEIG